MAVMKYFVEIRSADKGVILKRLGPHPTSVAAYKAESCINRTLNHKKFYTHIATE